MVGFDFKSVLLQVIHGSIVLVTCLILFVPNVLCMLFCSSETSGNNNLSAIVFLFAAYIIGVFIDFAADNIEGCLIKYTRMKSPAYYLLKNGRVWGIHIAHFVKIRQDLCALASKYSDKPSDYYCLFKEKAEVKDYEKTNYLLQTAKNKAFKCCSQTQKEQIDSFFCLYIFARNLALSLLGSAVLFLFKFVLEILGCFFRELPVCCSFLFVFGMLVFLSLTAALASYRYNIYYTRIILGATCNPDEKTP